MIIAVQTLIYFRESLLGVLARFLQPYYERFRPLKSVDEEADDEVDEEVFAEFDDEKGVVFFPPVYLQRYAAVTDCLMDERWCGKLEKVVDLGYNDMSFIKYLKQLQGVKTILGVDLESVPVRCSSVLLGTESTQRRDDPMDVLLFQGNAADPDYRLIGCDAVVAIEMIEHMLPHDLERLVHNIFGFIKPWLAVITTPNGDFNVLFKAMEKNGLRRLDHFFEWTREQFSDWCGNIIDRYPDYTVSYKGIGPGPSGTKHHGCCSQLALFVSRDYHKQPNLNLHSWLVSDAAPNKLSQIVDGWETSSYESNNMLAITDGASLSELYLPPSDVTVYLAPTPRPHHSPQFPMKIVTQCDKASQCNIAVEVGRNFIMFDEAIMNYTVLVARRCAGCRVYEIGDVASSLHCTTLEVNKFSKATQGIVARNKSDYPSHTNEVLAEIKQLTKMLEFRKPEAKERGPIWNNINWGDDAPFWNQYYKVIREFSYPCETKSEESRILEIIANEVNTIVDTQNEMLNRLEIPLDCLMPAVRHITDDVDRVREVLEWNGYEIQNHCVVHTRASLELEDFLTLDIGETDSLSENLFLHQSYHPTDCHLRRALVRKVHKLQTMTCIDKELSMEMDRILCRLMKLALKTSNRRQSPPPSRWLETKLYDLLSLAEKAIVRRRANFVKNYLNKGLESGNEEEEYHQRSLALIKYKDDSSVREIENKYRHLVDVEGVTDTEDTTIDLLELDDDFSATSKDLKDFELSNDDQSSRDIDFEHKVSGEEVSFRIKEDTALDRTQAWLEKDMATPNNDSESKFMASSLEIDNSTDSTLTKSKKSHRKHRSTPPTSCDKQQGAMKKRNSQDVELKRKAQRRNVDKSISNIFPIKVIRSVRKSPNYKPFVKCVPADQSATESKPEQILEENLQSEQTKQKEETLSIKADQTTDASTMSVRKSNIMSFRDISRHISATENSQCIEIIMDGIEETIVLKRNVGTDPALEVNTENEIAEAAIEHCAYEAELISIPVPNNSQDNLTEPNNSSEYITQPIFLYDLNEPSTSKGVRRHVNTDVQCGPDSSDYTMLSRTATKGTRIFATGIKIGDSIPDFEMIDKTGKEYGTCPENDIRETEIKSSLTFYSKQEDFQICKTNCDLNPEEAVKYKHNIKDSPDKPPNPRHNPSIFTAKLEIRDSLSDHKAGAKNIADFGMSTDDIDTGLTGSTNQDIHVNGETLKKKKKYDFGMSTDDIVFINVRAPEPTTSPLKKMYETSQETKMCSTMTETVNVIDSSNDFETKLLKPISSKRNINESISEFYGVFGSSERSSHSPELSAMSQCSDSTKYKKTKLSCVGSQVHSYKERQISEDVLYQGIWKKPKPQKTQKNIYTPSSKRLINASKNKDEAKDVKAKPDVIKSGQKPLPVRNVKVDQIVKKPQQSDSLEPSIPKTRTAANPTYVPKKYLKLGNNVTKVASKISKCSITSKGSKIAFGAKITHINMKRNSKISKVTCLPKTISMERKNHNLKETKLSDNKENLNRNGVCPKIKQDQERNVANISKQISVRGVKPEYKTNPKYGAKEKSTSKILVDINNVNTQAPRCTKSVSEKDNKPNTVNIIKAKNASPLKKQITKGIGEITMIRKDKSMDKGDTESSEPNTCKEMKKDLLAYHEEPFQAQDYIVFCNEIRIRSSDTDFTSPNRNNFVKNLNAANAQKRASSPGSDLSVSSTCSSVNSVVTIRSIKPPKCNAIMNCLANKATVKNIPNIISSSKQCDSAREVERKPKDEKNEQNKKIPRNLIFDKTALKAYNTSVFITQLSSEIVPTVIITDPPSVLVNGETSGSQTTGKITNPPESSDSKDLKMSPTLSDMKSIKSDIDSQILLVMEGQHINSGDDFINGTINEKASERDDNVKLTAEPTLLKFEVKNENKSRDNTDRNFGCINQNNLSSEIVMNVNEEKKVIDNAIEVRGILEDIIEWGSSTSQKNYDTKTVLSRRMSDIPDVKKELFDEEVTESPEKSLLVDTDTCSFKSTNSLSKYSDSYFGDSEHTSHEIDEISRAEVNIGTVKDLYERKDKLNVQTNVGPLTMQAFSGFSMNAEPAIGERPAYINYVDSEVGMPPFATCRQTTSEEMRVSAISATYETPADEDALVPSWLFQLVNNQQSSVEEVPSFLPHELAMLDVAMPNEGDARGGGAGDGCGMHSDLSQDSSGRGSSIISSQVSSPGEEAAPADPVQYDRFDYTNYDSVLDSLNNRMGQNSARPSSTRQLEAVDSSLERFRLMSQALTSTASDRDADVSSMGTNAPNSELAGLMMTSPASEVTPLTSDDSKSK